MSNKFTLKPDTVGAFIGNPKRFVCRNCLVSSEKIEEFPGDCETSSYTLNMCIRCECKDPAMLRAYFIECVRMEAWERIKELAAANDRCGIADEKLMLESTVQVLLERMAGLSLLIAAHGDRLVDQIGIVEVLSSQVANLCGSGNK